MRLHILLLCLLLIMPATAIEAVFLEDGKIISTENLTLVESEDGQLIYRCFLPAMTYSRIGGRYTGGEVVRTSAPPRIVYFNQTPNAPAAETPVKDAEPEDTLSTDLEFGKLFDDQGRLIGGETIKIEWEDEDGGVHSFTTTTLTKEEAERLGDPSLEGYYFFNKDRIGDADYRIIRGGDEELDAAPAPSAEDEESAAAEDVLEPGAQEEPPPTEPWVVNQRSEGFIAFFLKYWWWLLVPLGLLLLFVVYYWKVRPAIHEAFNKPGPSRIRRNLKRLYQQPAKEFMDTNFPTVPRMVSARELLAKLFAEEQGFCMVIDEGTLLGIVTVSDMLRALRWRQPDQTAVDKIMSMARTLDLSSTFSEVAQRALDTRIVPIMKGRKVAGVITRTHMLTMLDEFFSLNVSAARDLPAVRNLVQDAVVVPHDEKLASAIDRMLDKSSAIHVMGERLDGFLTERTIIEELQNYHSLLDTMDVARLMKEGAPHIAPDTSLLDANRIMLEHRFRTLAVVDGQRLLGVVTQRSILEAMHASLRNL